MEKSLGKYSDFTFCRQASPSDGLNFQKTFAQRIDKAKEACLADEHGAFQALQDAARAILTEESEKPSDFIQRVQWAESALSPILAVAVEFKLFQQLRDAGDQGLSSTSLASKTKIDQKELLRILLHLKSTNVIEMTSEGGFCSTRLSNSLAEPRFQASIMYCHYVTRQAFNGIPEYFRRLPNQVPSTHPNGIAGPFKIGHNHDLEFFEWLRANPPNEVRFAQFMQAYRAGNINWYDPGFYAVKERMLEPFDHTISDTLLVDVGGGKGQDLCMFADQHPDHPGKIVLQDQDTVIAEAIEDSRFECSSHDFFTPQPIRNAKAYSLHSVLHDWSDANALRILENLKPALCPGYSKVLINEIVLSEEKPTLAATSMDMMMLAHMDARERTESEFRTLLGLAGYRVVDIVKGQDGPTPQRELEYFVRSIAERNYYMTYREANFKSEEGRSFPYVVLSKQSTNGTLESGSGKLRVWLQAAIHGDEPAGDQALMSFLGLLDANATYANYLLDRMDILMLHRYNPDGVSYFQRTLATNFDPNRDSIKLARQQTRDIKTLFNGWSPHISGDLHEFGATTTYGKGNLVHSSDALFSAAKNLNIHPEIRKLSEDLFATSIGQGLEDAGFRWQPYITGGSSEDEDVIRLNEAGSDARIGRNAIGLSQTISFLFETRGIYLADQEFQRRTACGLTMITSLLDAAVSNYEQVYSTMTSAIKDFISSADDIVVTDSPTIEMREYPFVNTDTVSIVHPTVDFASTTPTNANLTRLRPEAYLIPRAWADVAERLRIYGLEVQELEYAYQGPVEALNVTSSTLGESRYEGAVLQTVETRTVNREISLPPGSFWMSTQQKNIGLAFNALEPENIDSYVTFGIIPLDENDEYPIFRVIG
ncbi:putative hydroxyindole O-methyltransferase [Hortaea werneckii]|nr:putative hydroxyindole O-methyltransferase [Hortaea werneckii]KAI7586417.1 putative hydroxyindole O-methyltransferase [Hortaea werneckii]